MESALPVKCPTRAGLLRRAAIPVCKAAHDLLCRPFEIPAVYRPLALGVAERPGAFERARQVRVRWLGTAGYEITSKNTTILIDPFVSRPGLLRLLLGRKIAPNPEVTTRYFPKADFILTGHSHFDHVMDVPDIAAHTGGTVVGSRSTCNVARCRGIPEERMREIPAEGATAQLGDFRVRFVPSQHGRFWFGKVPNDGVIHECPEDGWMKANEYKVGGAFGIHLQVGETSLYHNGSADLVDAEVEGLRADIVLPCLAGRGATPHYLQRLFGILRPQWVMPTHYDGFFHPLWEGLHVLPRIDMGGFFAETGRVAPRTQILMPHYEEGAVFSLDHARAPA